MVRAGARRQVVRLGPAIQAEAGRATRRLKEFLVGAGLGKTFHAFIALRLQPEAVTAPLLRDRARIDATLKMFGQNFRLPAAISLPDAVLGALVIRAAVRGVVPYSRRIQGVY
jgi:hypothetical protein